MIALLLDSSDKNLTVGLRGEKVSDAISYEAWQRQSELMVEEIKHLLERNRVAKEDLSCVVASKGPVPIPAFASR